MTEVRHLAAPEARTALVDPPGGLPTPPLRVRLPEPRMRHALAPLAPAPGRFVGAGSWSTLPRRHAGALRVELLGVVGASMFVAHGLVRMDVTAALAAPVPAPERDVFRPLQAPYLTRAPARFRVGRSEQPEPQEQPSERQDQDLQDLYRGVLLFVRSGTKNGIRYWEKPAQGDHAAKMRP
jgi:hypothetical protein